MLYSRTQDPQTFSVPTEKQSRGNQSRALVGTVTFPKHNSNADDSPPWQQTFPEWQAPLQQTVTGGVAESHQKPQDGYRAAFFIICPQQ